MDRNLESEEHEQLHHVNDARKALSSFFFSVLTGTLNSLCPREEKPKLYP